MSKSDCVNCLLLKQENYNLLDQLAHEKKWREHYERIPNLPQTDKMAYEEKLSEKSREVNILEKFTASFADRYRELSEKLSSTQSRLAKAEEALQIVVIDCEEGAWETDDIKHMKETRMYVAAKEALSPLPKPPMLDLTHGVKNEPPSGSGGSGGAPSDAELDRVLEKEAKGGSQSPTSTNFSEISNQKGGGEEELRLALNELFEDGECYCMSPGESMGRNPCAWCRVKTLRAGDDGGKGL